MVDKNMSAFPHKGISYKLDYLGSELPPETGMTLRDWFAGQALSGFCATLTGVDNINSLLLASDAYVIADDMLEVREKYND